MIGAILTYYFTKKSSEKARIIELEQRDKEHEHELKQLESKYKHELEVMQLKSKLDVDFTHASANMVHKELPEKQRNCDHLSSSFCFRDSINRDI